MVTQHRGRLKEEGRLMENLKGEERLNTWWEAKYRRSQNEVARLRRDMMFLVDGKVKPLKDSEMVNEIYYVFKGDAFSARQVVELANEHRALRISFIVRGVQLTNSYGSIGKKWLNPMVAYTPHSSKKIVEAHVPMGDRTEEQGKGKLYRIVE